VPAQAAEGFTDAFRQFSARRIDRGCGDRTSVWICRDCVLRDRTKQSELCLCDSRGDSSGWIALSPVPKRRFGPKPEKGGAGASPGATPRKMRRTSAPDLPEFRSIGTPGLPRATRTNIRLLRVSCLMTSVTLQVLLGPCARPANVEQATPKNGRGTY